MKLGTQGRRRFVSLVVMGVLIAATSAAFFFFIIVAGLSGGSASMTTAVALCFAALAIEVTVLMRVILRPRERYGDR